MVQIMTFLLVGTSFLVSSLSAEPNPPKWPANVYVFDDSNPSDTQSIVDKVFSEQGGKSPTFHGHWSNDRYAFLFKPGAHSVNVNIGYYTALYGTGVAPDDTNIQGVASSNGAYDKSHGALCNFWRSAENFKIDQSMTWSVSQASPLRKAYVNGQLRLSEPPGYSSGGYLSDCHVSKTIISGTQQQWFTRNTEMNSWNGGSWNMVFVGTPNAPDTNCGKYTNIPSTPVIAEKPYIVIDAQTSKHSLYVPRLEMDKIGSTKNYASLSDVIDFANVYVSTE